MTSASSTKYIGYYADSSVTYYYNDVAVTAAEDNTSIDDGDVYYNTTSKTFMEAGATDTDMVVPGVIVQFVDTDNDSKYDVVSAVRKTVAYLAAAPTTTTSGSLTYVTICTGIASEISDYVIYPSDLAKGRRYPLVSGRGNVLC